MAISHPKPRNDDPTEFLDGYFGEQKIIDVVSELSDE